MNFYDKLDGFQRLMVLNERAATKTLHVSLNFAPSESLTENKLIDIAGCYMDKIGFGDQPFLVYRHEDAGHPHVHIVSTTIQEDGSRINTHNLGRNQSEKARKELEQEYGLVTAESQHLKSASKPVPVNVEKAVYGAHETKDALARIVSFVFQQYTFCSLPEYNAALRQFNVAADRGEEGGRIHSQGGLVYRLLDGNGQKIGVPIKASALPGRPTLKALEARFRSNQPAKESHKEALKVKLDKGLLIAQTFRQLTELLKSQNVFVLPRQNGEGRMYGVTYVDNTTKCVFNGSEVGKGYSAAGLQSALPKEQKKQTPIQGQKVLRNDVDGAAFGKELTPTAGQREEQRHFTQKDGLFDTLITAKEQGITSGPNLFKKKRKKNRRPSNN